jgi:predicted GNAT family acetyltransferase
MTPDLVDNVERQRFEWSEDGVLAIADYRREPDRVVLTHFETPPEARGKGLAGRLMSAIVEDARVRGLKVEPKCSYAVVWMHRHPDVAAELEVKA